MKIYKNVSLKGHGVAFLLVIFRTADCVAHPNCADAGLAGTKK
jgi:hypothetical protein